VYQALNIDSLNFTGVESSVHLALSRTQTLDFRYTWLLGVQDTVPIGLTKYTFNYPRDSGVLAWQASLPGGIVARTRLGVLNRLAQGTYPLWEFYAAWSRGKIHPFLQLANITNTSYQEIQGVIMPGRTVLGGVEILIRSR